MLDQVVLTREAIAALARAVLDGAVAEDGVVHAGRVSLQVREACEGLAAGIATKGLCGPRKEVTSVSFWGKKRENINDFL